jgi:heme exporter protein A
MRERLQALELACIRGSRSLFSGLSFDLARGELLWIAGANGAGKTSLLRILCGLSPPDAGEVRWNDRPIRKLGETYRERLLHLGHAPAIKDDLTAFENLRHALIEQGLAFERGVLRDVLQRFGLGGREDLAARALSQGQRRRVALARLALGAQRTLWILDEPLNGVDAAAVQLVRDELARHVARGGMVVLTSHQEVDLCGTSLRRLSLD